MKNDDKNKQAELSGKKPGAAQSDKARPITISAVGKFEREEKTGGTEKPFDSSEYRKPLIIERRKFARAARRVARANKIALIVAFLIIVAILLLILAFCEEKTGNFTINLNRLELYRKGMSLSDSADFEKPTSRLTAGERVTATCISYDDILQYIESDGITEKEGEISSDDYVAYTFYIKNSGHIPMTFYASVTLDKSARGLQKALRVVLYQNDELHGVYALRNSAGEPEKDTVPWLSDSVVMEEKWTDFPVDQMLKYTIIIYIEGDDPDCTDDLIGGMVKCSMNFDEVSVFIDKDVNESAAAVTE